MRPPDSGCGSDYPIMTNLAAVVFPDDTLAVGVGHEGNMLRLWLP